MDLRQQYCSPIQDINMEPKEDWYFTFGVNTDKANKFYKSHGTYDEAREDMVNKFGQKWAFQYNEKEFLPQIERFNLTEIK